MTMLGLKGNEKKRFARSRSRGWWSSLRIWRKEENSVVFGAVVMVVVDDVFVCGIITNRKKKHASDDDHDPDPHLFSWGNRDGLVFNSFPDTQKAQHYKCSICLR